MTNKRNTNKIAEAIIHELGSSTATVKKLCQKYCIPRSTFYLQVQKNPALSHLLASARLNQAWIYADEIIDIADGCSPDKNEINKARLQIDARKFLLARLQPLKQMDELNAQAIANDKLTSYENMIKESKNINEISKVYEMLIKEPIH